MHQNYEIKIFQGMAILPHISQIAKLRIEIFCEYPFLYEGKLEYETKYLEKFSRMTQSICILALDKSKVVGVATGFPFKKDAQDLQEAFQQSGLNPSDYFCLGEAVLNKDYRKKGIGKQFYEERFKFAKEAGYHHICFYTIERDKNDPRKPKDYQSLDPMWKKMGFQKHPEIIGSISYPEIGQKKAIPHKMVFWTRPI